MSGRKALACLSLLCALVFCAFGAATASAAGGKTAVTCVDGGSGFTDAHCDIPSAGGTFGHSVLPSNPTEGVVGTNTTTGTESSIWFLNGKIAGVEVEFEIPVVHLEKVKLTNLAGPPMKVRSEAKKKYTSVRLLKPMSQAENCAVTFAEQEEVAESVPNSMATKFSPATGTTLTSVTISNAPGKTCKGIAGTFKLEGTTSATGSAGESETPKSDGATVTFSTATTEKTLVFAGNAAKLQGALTLRMGPNQGEGNPIAFTTE